MSPVTWVLESDVFPNSHQAVRDAVRAAGCRLVDWDDAWWQDGIPPGVGKDATLFHGSLGNAAAIEAKLPWKPGAFCKVSAFNCSAWYDEAREFLLHTDWRLLPANKFVTSAQAVCEEIGCGDRVFVRPDSPLKPFSGRVLDTASITLYNISSSSVSLGAEEVLAFNAARFASASRSLLQYPFSILMLIPCQALHIAGGHNGALAAFDLHPI